MNQSAITTSKLKTRWFQFGAVLVAGLALYFVFRRIEPHDLLRALRSARSGWLAAAIGVYGLTFLPGAWRWHLTLRLTGCAVHPGTSMRFTMIGHLFYTIFFGLAGGDFAKSALYTRWYGLSLPDILAASSLDRLLGLGGLIIFVALAFGLAALKGGFAPLRNATLNLHLGLMGLGLAVVVVAGFVAWRRGHHSAPRRMLRALATGGRRLLVCPGAIWQGLVCGILVQAALAGNLALSLQAVSHSALPWARLAWTFPVIAMISGLPVTVAGLGFREGAALVLLGLYGVSPAEAVAASLLTLVARLFWALVGGLILWREQHGRRQSRAE